MDLIQIDNRGYPQVSVTDYTFSLIQENTITKTTIIQKIPLGLNKSLESTQIFRIQQSNNDPIKLGG